MLHTVSAPFLWSMAQSLAMWFTLNHFTEMSSTWVTKSNHRVNPTGKCKFFLFYYMSIMLPILYLKPWPQTPPSSLNLLTTRSADLPGQLSTFLTLPPNEICHLLSHQSQLSSLWLVSFSLSISMSEYLYTASSAQSFSDPINYQG